MVDIILDTLIDFARLLPFLFLTYLLMELLERKAGGRMDAFLRRAGRFGPVAGGLLGAVPQCGFSALVSGLYAGRVVTLGTLFAVFLSTSDEMLPIMISHIPTGEVTVLSVIKILGVKVLLGMFFGFLVDLVTHRFFANEEGTHIGELCDGAHCHCAEHGVLRAALSHTVRIGLFILIFSFALNCAIFFIGEENLSLFLSKGGIFTPFLASLVGLIPNCAASIAITELYLSGALSVGGLYAGLLTGAGVGILVLARQNRPFRQSLAIIGVLYAIGAVVGVLIDLFGMTWLGL